MNKIIAWIVTFNFINITWIFFRAKDFDDVIKILKGMFGFSGITLPGFLSEELMFLNQWGITFGGFLKNIQSVYSIPIWQANYLIPVWIIAGFLIVMLSKNSMQLKNTFIPSYKMAFCFSILVLWTISNIGGYSEFLYFNF